MARVKSWYTTAQASGSVPVAGIVGDVVIATDLVNPTVLRTRAYVGLASDNTEHAAFSQGNATAAMVFRLVATPADAPPDGDWQFSPVGVDDVTMHPLVWNAGMFVPASLDLSRPDIFFNNAYLAGGVVDVKSERHFDGTVDVLLSYWIGPALSTATAGDPLFTAHWWFHTLIAADI